jgi:Uma2 family endonuclease
MGVCVGAETGFVLGRDPDTVLGPDAAVVRTERLPPPAEQQGFLERAPDLAVEIVSPNDRWTTVSGKVDAYLAAGVQLVWVIEPGAQAVRVFTPDGTERRLRANDGAVLEAEPVLPGFRLELRELFGSSSGA